MGHFVFFINLVINNTRIDTAMASMSTSGWPNVVQQKYNSKKTKTSQKNKVETILILEQITEEITQVNPDAFKLKLPHCEAQRSQR